MQAYAPLDHDNAWKMANGKGVVVNDLLPDGVAFMNDHYIFVNDAGYRYIVRWEQAVQIAQIAVRELIEIELAGVLSWLRAAGHDV